MGVVKKRGGIYNEARSMKKKISVRHPKTGKPASQTVLLGEKLEYDYSQSEWIALDTETLGLELDRDPVCSVQIASPDESSKTGVRVEILYTYSHQGKDPVLKKIIGDPKIEKIVHVFSFDLPRIERLVGVGFQGRVWDTKIMSRIGWSNTNQHGLNSLLRRHFKIEKIPNGDASDWALPYRRWSDNQIKYAAMDVLYLHELKERLWEKVRRINREEVLLRTLDCLPAVSFILRNRFDHGLFAWDG